MIRILNGHDWVANSIVLPLLYRLLYGIEINFKTSVSALLSLHMFLLCVLSVIFVTALVLFDDGIGPIKERNCTLLGTFLFD